MDAIDDFNKRVLPLLRYYIIHKLREEGLSEIEISKMLKITQAAVSKALNNRYKTTEKNVETILLGDNKSRELVNLIKESIKSKDYEKAQYLVCKLCYLKTNKNCAIGVIR